MTKVRSSIKQHLPNKPNKTDINVWAWCVISDAVYDVEVYTGKNNSKKDNEIEGILMEGIFVKCLTPTLSLNKNYKIFFDYVFSSIAMFKLLKKRDF